MYGGWRMVHQSRQATGLGAVVRGPSLALDHGAVPFALVPHITSPPPRLIARAPTPIMPAFSHAETIVETGWRS